jgi:hypothetical protein
MHTTYIHSRILNLEHARTQPANILLDQDYNVKVADFGLAAVVSSDVLACSKVCVRVLARGSDSVCARACLCMTLHMYVYVCICVISLRLCCSLPCSKLVSVGVCMCVCVCLCVWCMRV